MNFVRACAAPAQGVPGIVVDLSQKLCVGAGTANLIFGTPSSSFSAATAHYLDIPCITMVIILWRAITKENQALLQ